MGIMMLNYEIAVASQITAGNIPLNQTLSGTDQWSDYINSVPVTDIDQAKESVRKKIWKKSKLNHAFHKIHSLSWRDTLKYFQVS